jgi:DNA segregation ATPase FtsK/SpoIIIE-like protein
MIGIVCAGIKAVMSASIIGIGYYTAKNFTTKDKEEIIKTENILKYEYFPTEKVNTDKKDNVIKYTFVEGDKEGIKVCIGYDIDENLKIIDILEGHLLIGGMSNMGKSNILNIIITNIIRTYTSNEVILGGCDYAESDIYYFRKYKHFENIGMSSNKEAFLSQMKYLEEEMERRAKILDKTNCRNAIAYNKKHDTKMTYIVFVVDELPQLTVDKTCRDKLHMIMSKCRKYGIYFIIGTQDATKDIIGRCKMNCPQVIGLRTNDETDSITLIGKGYNLQDITVKGRCKIKNSDGVNEVQTFYISEEEIEASLKPFEIARE